MSFSFETFAWAVSALFQLLAVCAYLLSFPHVDGVCDQLPDIDGVDDQLPDMPEVIQGDGTILAIIDVYFQHPVILRIDLPSSIHSSCELGTHPSNKIHPHLHDDVDMTS